MTLIKPYRRVYRPIKSGNYAYVTDILYANDRQQLSRAYLNIEHNLKEIFNYVEPKDQNLSVFSFAIYSVFLQACTEVESNCRIILKANKVNPINGTDFTMDDYKKLNQSFRLSAYEAIYPYWRRTYNGHVEYHPKIFRPFFSFQYRKSPRWYRNYNDVKHNREEKFEFSTLNNCMRAVAALLVLLYAQFGPDCIEMYDKDESIWIEVGNYWQKPFRANVIFDIHPPRWDENDCYEFNWEVLKKQPRPIKTFPFE